MALINACFPQLQTIVEPLLLDILKK